MEGALNPSWVTSNGPSDCNELFTTEMRTSAATTPGIDLRRGSLILNVNKEGTGEITWWPSDSNSFQIFGLLPVAINSFGALNIPFVVFNSQVSFSCLISCTE